MQLFFYIVNKLKLFFQPLMPTVYWKFTIYLKQNAKSMIFRLTKCVMKCQVTIILM